MSTPEAVIATMQADISHLTKSFDEFKEESKEFHKLQAEEMQKLASAWQKMGGAMKALADLQAQINANKRSCDEEAKERDSLSDEFNDFKIKTVWTFKIISVLWGVVTTVLFFVYK